MHRFECGGRWWHVGQQVLVEMATDWFARGIVRYPEPSSPTWLNIDMLNGTALSVPAAFVEPAP